MWLGLFLLAIIMAASIAIIGPMTVVFSFGIVVSGFFLLTLQFTRQNDRYWILLLILLLPIFLALFRKFAGSAPFGTWQFLMMLLAMAGLREFLQEARQQVWLQVFLLVFGLFMAIAFASTFAGRSHLYGMAYQLISDLKPLLALALGYALCWNARMEKLLWFLVHWFWLPCMAFVAFEWILPSVYYRLFTDGRSIDPLGLFPSRASGIFEHPAMLAASGAMFALLAVGRALMPGEGESKMKSWFAVAMNFILIVCAVQRQELAGCILSGLLIYALATPKKIVARMAAGTLFGLIALGIFWLSFSQSLEKEASQWGYGNVGALQQPRAQIFAGAWSLADNYFPLGSGLGTYGGAGAEKFDHSVYDRLGFRNYWWYGKQDFLMDVYWPNSIAETGFFGALLLLLSYFLLLLYAVSRALKEQLLRPRSYWLTTAGMMAYMIMLSFSSPAFQDLRLFIIPAMMFGIASTSSKEANREKL